LNNKTVGIVGIGKLTNEFFNCLIDSDAGQSVLSQVNRFKFYDSRKSKEELEGSEKFIKLERILDKPIRDGNISLSSTSSLGEFYFESSMILFLAGGGFYDDHLKEGRIDKSSRFVYDKVSELQERGYFLKQKPDGFSRIEQELPHNLSIVTKFSQELQPLIRKYNDLKPIIMAANEPCITSSIMTSICPQLTDYVTGFSSVDIKRLSEVFNEELRALKKHCGLEDVTIKVGIKGNHNHKMTPKLYVDDVHDQIKLKQLFGHINYQGMFNEMQSKSVNYWETCKTNGINPLRQAAESLADLTQEMLNGLGKSLTPSKEMYNAFFHILVDNYQGVKIKSNQGLHFVGKHRLLNGKIFVKDEGNKTDPVDVIADKEFEICQSDHLKLFLEFFNENEVPELAKVNDLPTSKLFSPVSSENEQPRILVAQGRKGTLLFNQSYQFIEDKEVYFQHPCRSLNTMCLDGSVRYLLAGHDKNIVISNLEHPEEIKGVKVRLKNNGAGTFNHVAKLDDKLVASHHLWGVLNVNLEEFLDDDDITINKKNFSRYFMQEHQNGVRASLVVDDNHFLVATANTINGYDAKLKLRQSWSFPEMVTSFAYNGKQLFVGTNRGKIFTANNNGNKATIESGHLSAITNLKANDDYLVFNTFTNCPGSFVYFTELDEDGAIDESKTDNLEKVELYTPWLDLRGNTLYANNKDGMKLVKRDLATNEEISEIYFPRLGICSCIID
jgi:hypothetical protein